MHPGTTVRRDCIEKNGLSVTDAARILGVDRQTLSNLLNARSGISPEMAIRLEKAFGIKILKGEMMPEDLATNPNVVQEGRITPAGIEELKKRMPHSDFGAFEKDPRVDNLSKLFTVDAIVNFVSGKLA